MIKAFKAIYFIVDFNAIDMKSKLFFVVISNMQKIYFSYKY